MKSIIMAGGSGTRLWPYSRQSYPKQFLNLVGEDSFIEQTAKRLAAVTDSKDVYVVAGDQYQFNIADHLSRAFKEDYDRIITEPCSRNTAPAIALTVKYMMEFENCKEDEVLFFNTADHIIQPQSRFTQMVETALPFAQNNIVTFGIIPHKPETGYGYIELAKEKKDQVFEVKRFVEKPDLATAKQYVKSGNYMWNSGMFLFSIKVILKAFKQHTPELYQMITKWSYDDALAKYPSLKKDSIDYAIMEKIDNILCEKTDISWVDIGSWDSLYDILPKDENGNAVVGNAVVLDSKNSLIMSSKKLVTAIGLDNTAVISTPDAIMVSDRKQSGKVKEMVALLEKDNHPEALEHVTTFRPWGSYTVLEEGDRYKIKRIMVHEEARLSLQRHQHRSEHWVVIKGTALVEIDGVETRLKENESVYVPKYTIHRLANPGKIPLEIIEVQNGEYVGEDDIERFEDNYGRA